MATGNPITNAELSVKLNEALVAIDNAPALTRDFTQIKEAKEALTLAIQKIKPAPAPAPGVTRQQN